MTWSGDSTLGTEPFTYSYVVTSLPSVSVSNYFLVDCFRVARARNGREDNISVYCPAFGLVMFESLTQIGWMHAELIDMTTARISLQDVVAVGPACEYVLQGIGFSPDEEVTVRILAPAGQSFADGTHEITLAGADALNSFTILLSPEQVASSLLIELEGSEPSALSGIPPGPRRALYMIRPSDTCQ